MTRRRILPLVALALALLLATTESASASARRGRLTIPLPKPGHVTVAAFETKAGASAPRRIRLAAPGARKLPPSVKVLWATRSIRVKGGRRYAGFVLVVRRADVRAAHAASEEDEPTIFDLIFAAAAGRCVGCGQAETVSMRNLDLFGAGQDKPLEDLFRRDWKDPEAIFGSGRRTPDPTLDTGHYDDGHAFGWGTGRRLALRPPDVRRVDIDLVQDLLDEQQGRIVSDLEVATKVDLSGDGVVGAGSGQQINTTVG
ncbi:MAG TPA: hypothetical protein VFU94_03775 [Conexibacter sp.]|nr:hypothetical protein [Conexibacter sp.]